jgi:hypothetical protein
MPFDYEVDASLEYVVQTIGSLHRPAYWFMDGIQVDIQPDAEKSEYRFQIRTLKASSKTPSNAYAEGRIYKVSRGTVMIEGASYIDMKRFYRLRLPALVLLILFVILSNIGLAMIPRTQGLILLVDIGFLILVFSSSGWLPHTEQQKVFAHVDQAIQTINKSKNAYYKPPKPVRSPDRPRPATMQRRQK